MTNAIKIENLTKTYKSRFSKQKKEALKGIDLEIPQGSFFGLLGPNGAGKSTLINILAGLVVKTSGSVTVNGFDLDTQNTEVRRNIGIVPQEVVIDPFFNVRETLEYYAGYYGIKKADRKTDEILKALHLTDKADVNPRRLSGGMKRRLLIAKALVHSPKILVLDEPTAGVDVELRTQLWEYVKYLNGQGVTILLTTHYLEEAEALCDRIAIINHGEVIANDTTKKLLSSLDNKNLIFRFDKKIDSVPGNLEFFKPELIEEGRAIKVAHNKDKSHIDEIINNLRTHGLTVEDISSQEPDLEDVFRHLTKAQ